ncbi:glutamyl endopeptidase [Fusarium austroafricanum]|uniref:Glutamyl endopeptidase n=1 Tax=Fusarium austroafricanum TaxID=2364996 RepID=A0A8H4KBJ7_9HYPO|nr:glutamyl endopeptidase [Fusarium austroafricanum]
MASSRPGRAAVWKLSPPSSSHPPESASLPGDGSRGGESIIGEDMRQPVDPMDIQDGGKYRSIVKVYARFKGQGRPVWMMGTGWLIRPDLLVTAGHLVYDWGRHYGAATEIKCYIGYNGRASINRPQVQTRYGTNVVTTAEWVETQDNRLKDVAFVQLDRPFTGNLRVLSYINTPRAGRDVLGVVGYPGDKALEDPETGEYQPGQGGAPILSKSNGRLIAIGTHCYGSGGADLNSGNSIGNSYGNDYNAFVSLFNNPSAFGEEGRVRVVETGAGPIGIGGREAFNHGRASMAPRASVSEEEGFFDVFKSVAKVGATAFPSASPFLGPIGGAIGSVVGGLLGSLAGASELSEDSFMNDSGAPQRAILAESSLQAILACEQNEELMEVLNKMQTIWGKAPQIDALVPVVIPVVAEYGAELAAQQPRGIRGFEGRESSFDFESGRRELRVNFEERSGDNDFVQGLMGPTLQLAGQEGMIDWLGPVLKTAVSSRKSIASREASVALSGLGRTINETSIASDSSNTNEAAKILLQRAVLADAALQALVTLPRETLAQLTPGNIETGERGFFDFMKGVSQKLGPAVEKATKDAARKYGPQIINAANRYSKSQPGFGGGPNPPVQIRGKRPSLFDMLNQ